MWVPHCFRGMEPSLRKAMLNLQGMFDEGFVNKKEFEARRKALLDKATAMDQAGPAKSSSVFDRLGTPGDKWSHDGFDALYGKAKKSKQTGQTRVVTVSGWCIVT